ncbi:MAG TPA: tetratricopeptide repeat protein [Vicinamibacterales bacterium]|nr:tetratricopeptide repeat protein [Vicinamibacterales bacterium]
MAKKISVALSVLISFALAGALVLNYRHARETDQQLADLRQKVGEIATGADARGHAASSTAGVAQTSTFQPRTRSTGDLDQTLRAGWALVNRRNRADAAQAVQLFEKGLNDIDPQSAELYNGLGRALLIADRPVDAIAAWRKGLAIAPMCADMQSGVGWAYWRLNDPARARNAWEKALGINPHSIDAWSAVAWVDLALGNVNESKAGFQELVAFDPKRRSWVLGLAMAQGGNHATRDISELFPLPPLEAFDRPLAHDPAVAN